MNNQQIVDDFFAYKINLQRIGSLLWEQDEDYPIDQLPADGIECLIIAKRVREANEIRAINEKNNYLI